MKDGCNSQKINEIPGNFLPFHYGQKTQNAYLISPPKINKVKINYANKIKKIQAI